MSWLTLSDITQGGLSALIVIVITVAPFIFGIFLYKNIKNLQEEDFERKFGSMYQGVWLVENSKYAIGYSVVFLLRRLLFVILTFALFDFPGLQIQAFIWTSILYLVYLNAERVQAEPFTLVFENMNEFTFLIVCYHFVLFTGIVNDPYII